jgi:hypothetical protein
VTRPRTIRLLQVVLLVAGAVWLTTAIWLEGPPPRAVIPVTSTRFGGSLAVGLAFAPSGMVVATAARDGSSPGDPLAVRLWDCDTGRLRAELFRSGERHLEKLEFSSDGKRLRAMFAKADVAAVCWDVASATECDPGELLLSDFSPPDKEIGRTPPPSTYLPSASHDARTANGWAFLSNGRIWIESDGDDSPRKIVDTPWGLKTNFAISPDGTQLVLNGPPSASLVGPWLERGRRWLGLRATDRYSPDKAVTRVVDVASKKEVLSWPTPFADYYKFSPDGRTLAVVNANRIAFYDAPLHFPWLRKLTLGSGVVIFLAGCLILGRKSWLFRRRHHP